MKALRNLQPSMPRFTTVLKRFSQRVLQFQTLEHRDTELGLALEKQHLETTRHCERVLRYATALGEIFGLHRAQLEALQQGAYLHDLGKLAVPDTILGKSGALEPEEWVIMKTHVEYGVCLAAKIPGLRQGAFDVIRYHHERWDGTGYPNGLRAEAIPLEARLFAVCDVYDALTSERPYKRAWTQTQAIAQLRLDAGKHFDPNVVEAFVDTLNANLGVTRSIRHERASTGRSAQQLSESLPKTRLWTGPAV